jgi:DNA repair exonuclease SbcCD ATPase subunit
MSKVTFETIWFKNFMSFGNVKTTVDLTRPGTTLIVGENADEGGSSGAGKTTVLNALSYVLYDKIPRDDVKKDKMINNINGGKNVTMEVGLNVTVGTDKYIIERRRGQAAGVQLWKNGVDITPDSIANFNAACEELVGFSYNLFSQILLFNGSSTPFLSLSGPEQRSLIEELLRITLLSRKAEALKLVMSGTESELKIQLALIEQQKKHAERHQQLIAAAEKRVSDWNIQHAADVRAQEAKLEALLSVDFDAEEQIHAMIKELQDKIAPIDAQITQHAAAIRAERAKVYPGNSKIAVMRRDLAALKTEKAKYESELAHLEDAKCPYCLQKFEDAAAKLADLRVNLDSCATALQTLSDELQLEVDAQVMFETSRDNTAGNMELDLESMKASKVTLANELSDYQAVLTYKTYKDHVNAASMAGTLADKIDRMKSEVNPHLDAHAALLNDPGVKIDTTQVDELSRLKEHQKVLHKLLTDKNSYIRKGIISKTLPFLNKRIAYYTERLGLPHVVLFQPDMTCEITKMGLELSHGNLSNGEQKRLNLGLCFAFRDALTYLHSKVNLLMTDEVDGGSLDEQAVSAMISLLKHKAWDDKIGIFIISHRPEFDGKCDRNLIVRKESGFSSLIKQID